MGTRRIGIVMNGVAGGMGTHQHLVRSVLAISRQGGAWVSDDLAMLREQGFFGRILAIRGEFFPARDGRGRQDAIDETRRCTAHV